MTDHENTNPDGTPRTSNAVSAQYPRPCPRCHAGPYQPCRAKSGRVTDTHLARING